MDTSDKDTPILAAASAAKAEFVVTENVKDFGRADLEALSMSAVHPDMFLTTRVTDEEYCFVLESIAERRQRDPRTPAAIHAAEAPNKLPRLFLAHRDRFRLDPKIQPGNPARVQFRGARCVLCATISKKPDVLINGLCQLCLGATAG
ncbi:MAG: hypothetical protein LBE83_02000 [Propionibacteriaceae bacterium]|nr:hypothetical protein [Propionibacteriaceae bacterium]